MGQTNGRVFNLRLDNGYKWDVYDIYNDKVRSYHAPEFGGLWETNIVNGGFAQLDKQERGTCDFSLTQKTMSGVRKALNKYFTM